MSPTQITFPSLSLTEEETQQTHQTISRNLGACAAILDGVRPISASDYSEALRHIRCALTEAEMLRFEDPATMYNTHHPTSINTRAALTACFVYKGDCLAGLGKFREAQDAYEAVAYHEKLNSTREFSSNTRTHNKGPRHKNHRRNNNKNIGDITSASIQSKICDAKRKGTVWNSEHQVDGRDVRLSVLGGYTEHWDPEPPLQVQDVGAERWPRTVKVDEGHRHSVIVQHGFEQTQKNVPPLRKKKLPPMPPQASIDNGYSSSGRHGSEKKDWTIRKLDPRD